jgi:hypothetical protein
LQKGHAEEKSHEGAVCCHFRAPVRPSLIGGRVGFAYVVLGSGIFVR